MDEEKYQIAGDSQGPDSTGGREDRSWTFDLSTIFLAVFGAVISYHGFNMLEWEFLMVGVIALIASVWFFVWPEVLRRRSQDIKTFNENMHDLKTAMSDLETVRKEHNRARAAYERSREAWESGGAQLVENMQGLVGQLGGSAKYEQQLVRLRQESGEMVRQLDDWRGAAIEHVDFLDRTLGLAGLDEKYVSAIEKARLEYVRGLEGLGLTEIRPSEGEEFDDRRHMADSVVEKQGVGPGRVVDVLETGFATGNRVIRPAKVTVTPD